MNKTRVLIVDDHIIVRKGIQMFLDTESHIEIVGEAEDAPGAIVKAKSLQPHVILMDLMLPLGGGVEAIAEIKRSTSHVKIVVLSSFGEEPRVRAAMEAGADGYLLKDADGNALLDAIHAVRRGDTPIHPHIAQYLIKRFMERKDLTADRPLTERENQVLQLVARGLSNKGVAQSLGLSEGTAKIHISNILKKLNVASRTEACVKALQTGLISPVKEIEA